MRSDCDAGYLELNCSSSVSQGRQLKPHQAPVRAAARRARAAQLRCKPVNVYPVPPTRGVPGSAVPITIELAITVRVTEKGGESVLAGVPVDVNLPASVIVHTPMYPVNDTPLYAATPDAAL